MGANGLLFLGLQIPMLQQNFLLAVAASLFYYLAFIALCKKQLML